jgi:hypothetical protein
VDLKRLGIAVEGLRVALPGIINPCQSIQAVSLGLAVLYLS